MMEESMRRGYQGFLDTGAEDVDEESFSLRFPTLEEEALEAYRRGVTLIGNWKEAAEAFKLSLSLEPDFAKARYGFALCSLVLGEKAVAEEQLRYLEKLDAYQAAILRELLFPAVPL
jgi:hypothetical protein